MERLTLRLTTCEGYGLVLCGICRRGTAQQWRQKLAALGDLCFPQKDLYEIDFVLASAMQQLSDPSLLLAGASLSVLDAALQPGESTGGVLGDPNAPIASSEDEIESLPRGFSLFTAPGGPGIAADCPPEALALLCQAIRQQPSLLEGPALAQLLRSHGARHALLVFDGTGPGIRGVVAAMDEAGCDVLLL